jgi:hypothetical protein
MMVASSILAVHCYFSPWILGSGCSAQLALAASRRRAVSAAHSESAGGMACVNALTLPSSGQVRMFARLKDSAVAVGGSNNVPPGRGGSLREQSASTAACACYVAVEGLSAALALLDLRLPGRSRPAWRTHVRGEGVWARAPPGARTNPGKSPQHDPRVMKRGTRLALAIFFTW